jgi:hypothetical protein
MQQLLLAGLHFKVSSSGAAGVCLAALRAAALGQAGIMRLAVV